MAKHMYYCGFCMKSCAHVNLKDHYFVRVEESTRCICAYSGSCKSDNQPTICADLMGVTLRKQYHCLKCKANLCLACIQICQQAHPDWVQERKELAYFKCKSKDNQYHH